MPYDKKQFIDDLRAAAEIIRKQQDRLYDLGQKIRRLEGIE